MKYKIYAGLRKGFNGAEYIRTVEEVSEEQANQEAFEEACQIYDSYAGLYGIMSWEECVTQVLEEHNLEEGDDYSKFEEEIDALYKEEQKSWIDYYIKIEKEPDQKNK